MAKLSDFSLDEIMRMLGAMPFKYWIPLVNEPKTKPNEKGKTNG